MSEDVLAWHFIGTRLRDGRPIPADGEWLVHEGEAVIGESGLHASVRIINALQYATGSTICRVTCREIVDWQSDKLVCRERRIDWRVTDADDLLRAFARKAALSVIHLWNVPDIVRRYLETGDESIRAAAWNASWAYAGAAAGDAARAASRAASRNVAWASVRAAAWASAGASRDAWDAAWDAAFSDFNTTLEQMVTDSRREIGDQR